MSRRQETDEQIASRRAHGIRHRFPRNVQAWPGAPFYLSVRVDDDHPYRCMANAGRLIRVHRLVAACVIGIPLPDRVVVHHENDDPTDNRPENLWLLPSQREHAALHNTRRSDPSAPLPDSAISIGRIEDGLPLDALERVTRLLAPDDGHFKYRLVPRATLERRKRGTLRLSSEEGMRVARLARVWNLAVEVWGSEDEVAAYGVVLADRPVVRPQPAVVAERVAVGLLHRRPGRRAHVGDEQAGPDVAGHLLEVRVGPGGLDTAEQPRHRVVLAVPPDAEPVGVERGRPHRGLTALVDQGVPRLGEERLQRDRRTRVRQPAAHGTHLLEAASTVAVGGSRWTAAVSHRTRAVRGMAHPGHVRDGRFVDTFDVGAGEEAR